MTDTGYTKSVSTVGAYSASQTSVAPGTGPFRVIIVSGALAFTGTSSSLSQQVWDSYVWDEDSTSSGANEQHDDVERLSPRGSETGSAMAELRRISGLTWDQLAQLFAVSRRSVHFWASGKPLSSENEQHLMAVLDVVQSTDRGSASANKTAILKGRPGERVYDLLCARSYDAAAGKLGIGEGRVRPKLALTRAELDARRPPAPDSLISDPGEVVHTRIGRGRPAQVRRDKGRGTT